MIDVKNPSIRPSFREAICRAEGQVGYRKMLQRSDKLGHRFDMEIIHEMCAIMAEVYMMDPWRQLRISGEWLDVYMVQQVFSEIREEHVCQVLEDYNKVSAEIKNKKAYLRAMLYNVVFCLEASVRNETMSGI